LAFGDTDWPLFGSSMFTLTDKLAWSNMQTAFT